MVDNIKVNDFVNNLTLWFLLITYFVLLITILKFYQTKLGFKKQVLDYLFLFKYPKKLLKFYPNLSTFDVNLKLTEYQAIRFRY